MNDKTIIFNTTLDPEGLASTLKKINVIGATVDLFKLAAVVDTGGGATVKLISKDFGVEVHISGQFVNRDVQARLNEIGDIAGGRYNSRTGTCSNNITPGHSHIISSKTKLGKVMKYLGADPAAVKAFRGVSAQNLLKITDLTREDDAPGVTRVEVFQKDDRVQASWVAVVKDVDLNVELRCTATCAIEHRQLRYEIEFDYDRGGPLNVLRELLVAGGFLPFDGDIQ